MSSYAGRHRGATPHGAPRPRQTFRTVRQASPVATTARLAAHAGRPVVVGGVAAAVVTAGAAGLAWAGPNEAQPLALDQMSRPVAYTAPAVVAKEQQDIKRHANESRAAAAKVAGAKQEAARQALAARQAEAERASREAQRQSVLANAQNDPRGAARTILADFGWSESQFSCLDSLWTKESNWRYTASNSSSGAYGIPQALPGSKMSSVASDWRTNPVTQITWGLRYIQDVYGTPCSAWGHSQSSNWY